MDDPNAIDLSSTAVRGDVLEARVQLPAPQPRLVVKLPAGEAGRAEAVTDQGIWGAKHYWRLEPGVMAYEFDGPLPAGPLLVRIPLLRR